MKLDERTLYLIAVGAAITAHCQPCLEHNIGEALAHGADEQEIAEAMRVGRLVRQGAASTLDQFALRLGYGTAAPAPATPSECGCRG